MIEEAKYHNTGSYYYDQQPSYSSYAPTTTSSDLNQQHWQRYGGGGGGKIDNLNWSNDQWRTLGSLILIIRIVAHSLSNLISDLAKTKTSNHSFI